MSERQHDALRRSLGALSFLGVEHMRGEWQSSLAVWSYGREPSWHAALPYALVGLAGGSALAFTLGWRWRLAGGVFCASLAGLYGLAPVTYHNNLYLLWLMVLLAVLTGGRWKGDGLFARLVRWQVAFVYLASVVVKLSHPFWQGSGAVIRWLAAERVPMIHDGVVNPILQPLLVRPDVSALIDHATMAVEVAVPVMLLRPRWRRAGFALGVALHWGFQLWLHPQLFTFLMLWGYFAFAPADDRTWRAHCLPATARWITRLDWLGRVDARDGDALTVTTPEGQSLHGLAAVRALASLTPVTVLVVAAFALALPELQRVGGVSRAAVEEVALALLGALALGSMWTQQCSPPRR